MNPILVKQEINSAISKEQFIEDVECLFNVLQEAYGLYEYYGSEFFQKIKENVLTDLRNGSFDLDYGSSLLRKHLYAVIRDGHLTIGNIRNRVTVSNPNSDYAVKYDKFHGIDVIDCKKFWYDTDDERPQLEDFIARAAQYKNEEPLIIDLRDCVGGSDTYIWKFIKGLFDVEAGFSCKFRQKNSKLFREYIHMYWPEFEEEDDTEIEQYEQDASVIEASKKIYVLINENTCSAGESAIAFLKTITGTTIVGTRSGGCFVCGNCMEVYLPNSHLPAYFGTGMCLYEKTRNIDAEGGFLGDISYEDFVKLVIENEAAK